MVEILEKYYNDGLLYKQVHPVHDLTIWNYSQKVQFERLWDDVTLQCRGLVTNSKGDIVARPFKKFFNYEEIQHLDIIPNEPFDMYDKMDGSLGILFHYNYEWILATRGSFTSDQAIKGKQILDENYDVTELLTRYTYLLEIIYPENRIVIDYGKEMLVLLGAIHTFSGDEVDYPTLGWYSKMCGYPLVKKYDGFNDFKQIKEFITDEQEGFVIRFKNGFRMKIKGEEYCRLHRILTNISSRDIWEILSNDKPIDEILEKVPDEFFNWVKDTIKDFEQKFDEILGTVITDFWDVDSQITRMSLDLGEDMVYTEKEYNKIYAELAFKKKYPHLLFSYKNEILNPKNTHKAIWKMLYPEFQKPFKKELE